MNALSPAERKGAERARKRLAGLKPYELWLTVKELKAVRALLRAMRGDKT